MPPYSRLLLESGVARGEATQPQNNKTEEDEECQQRHDVAVTGHATANGSKPDIFDALLSISLVDYTQQDESNMQRASANEPSRSVLAPVRAVFRAVVVTIVPEAQELDEGGWSALEGLVEDTLATRPPALRRQLQLFLRAIEWLPVLRYGRTFTSLKNKERSRVLGYLQDHAVERIRCGFWGLRTLVFLGYYGRPEGARAIGYAPDPRGWEALG